MRAALGALLLSAACAPAAGGGANGGTGCAACAIVAALAKQRAAPHRAALLNAACARLLPDAPRACAALAAAAGAMIDDGATPDAVCGALGLCKSTTGAQCHLYPLPSEGLAAQAARMASRHAVPDSALSLLTLPKICNNSVIRPICNWIDGFADDHSPLVDIDGDRFSTAATFRGSDWRGKDCSDVDAKVYPGRRAGADVLIDSDCNGVWGVDNTTLRGYESEWCDGTQAMGVIAVGDSATAHFHIPPSWLEADRLDFTGLLGIAENELDWPHLSWSTGHGAAGGAISGPVDSLYLRMRELNLCSHRDYQNIGLNGARSTSATGLAKAGVARDAAADRPALAVLSLIGNDVCNGHPDTEAHMTTVADFVKANTATLAWLDQTLPPGSRVLTTGLVDGRVLWDSMSGRTHPVSHVDGVVKYADVYTFLNCLEVSPCTGWMNANATLRDATSARARALSAAWRDAVPALALRNVDAAYTDFPLDEVIAEWTASGRETWELIEPVDGFHPNQQAQALSAAALWRRLVAINTTRPGFLPPPNPHNPSIAARFGAQGGY